jgi:hypothetical protein
MGRSIVIIPEDSCIFMARARRLVLGFVEVCGWQKKFQHVGYADLRTTVLPSLSHSITLSSSSVTLCAITRHDYCIIFLSALFVSTVGYLYL